MGQSPIDDKRRKKCFIKRRTQHILFTVINGVRHMVKDHSDSETEIPRPPHGLHFSISSKGYFICTIP